jgi:hypothetical protein
MFSMGASSVFACDVGSVSNYDATHVGADQHKA